MRPTLLILFLNISAKIMFAQTTIPNISDNDKILGLSIFWKEASYNFVNFDKIPTLNWDSAYASFIPNVLATKNLYEYSRELKKFSALLHDGHTGVSYYVDTLNYYRHFGKYKLKLKEFDDKIYVVNTAQKTKDEIPVGSEILSIDNIPVEKYLTDSILPYFGGSTDYIRQENAIDQLLSGLKGTSVNIQIKTPENKIREFQLTRERCNDKWFIEPENNELISFKWLNDQIAYVALNSFMDNKIDSLFEAIIPELLKCKGLIIDVRENEGGNGYYANEIIKHLTDKPYFLCERSSVRKSLSSYKAWGVFAEKNFINAKCNLDSSSTEFKENYKSSSDFRKMYEYYLHLKGKAMEASANDTVFNKDKSNKLLMPLVVLIGHNTASASEDFLIGLDYVKRATFMGQKTYGSTGQPYSFGLPGGGFARVCAIKCTYPDGREFVGIGIKPDIEINPTLKDYLNKNDVTLKEATNYLTDLLKKNNN
jgi:C-terminal processing protease CtpA/Prc